MLTKIKYVPIAFRQSDYDVEQELSRKTIAESTRYLKQFRHNDDFREDSDIYTGTNRSDAAMKATRSVKLLPIEKTQITTSPARYLSSKRNSVTSRIKNETLRLDRLFSQSQSTVQVRPPSVRNVSQRKPIIIAEIPQGDSAWKCNEKIVRLNNAFKLQQIHFEQKVDQQWKNEAILKLLQKKILQEGQNIKSGMRTIFVMAFHEKYRVRGNYSKSMHQLSLKKLTVYQYYIPVYKKIRFTEELQPEWEMWVELFTEVFKINAVSQSMYFWLLDGYEITGLEQVPPYEKILYLTIGSKFDFWEEIGNRHKIPGEFKHDAYDEFLTVTHDLKTKEDIYDFFKRRENLTHLYHVIELHHKHSRVKRGISGDRHNKKINIETVDRTSLVSERTFDTQFTLLDHDTKVTLVEIVQQLMDMRKSKYSHKIKSLQEALENRYTHILNRRIHTLKSRAMMHKSRTTIKVQRDYDEFEDMLMDIHEVEGIEEIKNEALHEVQKEVIFHAKQVNPLREVHDPFELVGHVDMHNLQGFMMRVNIAKIMMDKNLSRTDVVNLLTVFKCLLDSDFEAAAMNKLEQLDGEVDLPIMRLSKKQLVRCIPYVVLYKDSLSVGKLNEILKTERLFVTFDEFIDCFNKQGEEDFVIDSQAFI